MSDESDQANTDLNSLPPEPDLPGYRIGRYLGGGASGMVWAVTRCSDDARLAAKVLLAPVEEALIEVAYLERLEHDHVLRLHDSKLDVTGPVSRLVLICDLAEGGSLGSAIAGRGHLTTGELVTVLTPLARTLHDLHGQGLVHGDLSPSNVLFDGEGKPLLADFGVARLAADRDAEVWGTPGFVAPEVLAGGAPDAASDVYALGALAWTALVGEAPPPAALRPHLPDVAPQAPVAVCDLVLSCLSHTPQARPNAGELALAIWDSAPAEPAPRAESAGARTARVSDPWAGLTQRIRETATVCPPEPEKVWHQMPAVRRTLLAAGIVGLIGGAVVVWPQSGPLQVEGEVVAAENGVARPHSRTPSSHSAAASHRAPVKAIPPREQRRTPARSSASAAPKKSRTPTQTTPDVAPSVPAHRAALRKAPRGVVQRLVDARAKAWTGGQRHLPDAMVVDSAAWRRDRADLTKAKTVGARYDGLRFTVRSASVRSESPKSATVEAIIDRSAYRVAGSSSVAAPPHLGQRVTLTLQATGEGWRIADWAEAV